MKQKVLGLLCLAGLIVLGVIWLAAQKEHGELLLLPLVLLGITILTVVSISVGIVKRIEAAWRSRPGQVGRRRTDESIRRRNQLEGVATLAITAAAVAAIYGAVDLNVENRRPDPGLTAALSPACAGQPVPGAGSVSTGAAVDNHLVVLDTSGHEHSWTGYPPLEWRPPSLADTELVACISPQETRSFLQTCRYEGGMVITRYRVSRDVAVFEAATGKRVTSFSVSDDPRECGALELKKAERELEGNLTWAQVEARLSSFVDGAAAPAATPGPVSMTPSPGAIATPAAYIVKVGDTLSTIAAKFGVSVVDLVAANKATLPNPKKLHVGDRLVIPPPR